VPPGTAFTLGSSPKMLRGSGAFAPPPRPHRHALQHDMPFDNANPPPGGVSDGSWIETL